MDLNFFLGILMYLSVYFLFVLLFKLEMERAMLDVEHNNELKNIQNDEAKLKHLQQEHQLRVEAFNLHTSQVKKKEKKKKKKRSKS